MAANAIPVAAIVMGGVLLTAIAWKVLDLAMHAMSLERGRKGADEPSRSDADGDDHPDARR